eukprot:jgi/Mesen1/3170/ME000184S02232
MMGSPLWASPGNATTASPGSPWGQIVYSQNGQAEGWAEGTGVLADVEAAGRLLSDTLGRDERGGVGTDLMDALDASRMAGLQYTSNPRAWPPAVEVVQKRELPAVVLERYAAAGGQGTALCGFFPTIRHAWATVDNSFFIWRFDKWLDRVPEWLAGWLAGRLAGTHWQRDGRHVEYSGEEQAICAVGLVKPRPGVFIEAIQHLVVLATPADIVLLGLCLGPASEGRDPLDDVSLQPLPEYTVPSDGVVMTCVACTEDGGRIFLGGRDGHLYEVHYSASSGWQRRCHKTCHTATVSSFLSKIVLPSMFRFTAQDPLVEMAIDEERQILYTRTQESRVAVFDLGYDGQLAPRKVAEERHLADQQQQRDYSLGGGGAPLRGGHRGPRTQIVAIAPISTVESKHLHLLAILSDGRRLYLSTDSASSTGGGPGRQPSDAAAGGASAPAARRKRPGALKVMATRQAPPRVLAGGGAGMLGGMLGGGMLGGMGGVDRVASDGQPIKLEGARYSAGLLVLSDASPPTHSNLVVASRDLSLPPSQGLGIGMGMGGMSMGVGGGVGASAKSVQALREAVSVVPEEGRALAVADVLPPDDPAAELEASVDRAAAGGTGGAAVPLLSGGGGGVGTLTRARKLWARGALASQHAVPRREIVVLCTAGMMALAVNRPVDTLQRFLEGNVPRQLLEEFFQRYGQGEAAAMCLLLAAGLTSGGGSGGGGVPPQVAEKAAEAFEDPRLVGAPHVPTGALGAGAGGGPAFSQAGGFAGYGARAGAAAGAGGGFDMGQLVQEAEVQFSGAHEGLCVCSARLLRAVWEFPVVVGRAGSHGATAGGSSGKQEDAGENAVVACRLSGEHMQAVESRARALELFLRTRRNQKRGPYGRVVGASSSAAYRPIGGGLDFSGAAEVAGGGSVMMDTSGINGWETPVRGGGAAGAAAQQQQQQHASASAPRRQRLAHSPQSLLAMEHHIGRLAHSLPAPLRGQLLKLTFHQLVCAPAGDQVATQLVAALMQLREGCPSYYSEADHIFFRAVEALESAAAAAAGGDVAERDRLAADALQLLARVPESANLLDVCPRFEHIGIVLPSMFRFTAQDPLVEMAIDEERQILYTRTQESRVAVFDLGYDGQLAPRKVAEERHLADQQQQRDYSLGGGGAPLRGGHRGPRTQIVAIAPISTVESKHLHLLAILSDGRRLYLSTDSASSTGGGPGRQPSDAAAGGASAPAARRKRPGALKVMATRQAPPRVLAGGGAGMLGGMLGGGMLGGMGGVDRVASDGQPIKLEGARYSAGLLVLSDASPPTHSNLVVASRDLSLPPSQGLGIGMGMGGMSMGVGGGHAARWPDALFHERLYGALVEMGLEQLLLDIDAPDLELFLRSAGTYGAASASGSASAQAPFDSCVVPSMWQQARAGGGAAGTTAAATRQPITAEQGKYLALLSQYYVRHRQHALAAHVFLRLAERRQPEGGVGQPGAVTLEERYEYLSHAVVQAKSQRRGAFAGGGGGGAANGEGAQGGSLLELLEDKLAVLRFQMRIRDALLQLASRQGGGGAAATESATAAAAGGASTSTAAAAQQRQQQQQGFPGPQLVAQGALALAAQERARELEAELKSITELYNDYAFPFHLYEIALEILHFSSYASDADNSVELAMWRQLVEQGLATGGVAEACERVRRVGAKLGSLDPGSVPLDLLVLQLEQAAHERLASEKEQVGYTEVPAALLAACGGGTAAEPVYRAYERLLARPTGAVQVAPMRLRLLSSVLAVLREWTQTLLALERGERVTSPGASALLRIGGPDRRDALPSAATRGPRGIISSACNRCMRIVRR